MRRSLIVASGVRSAMSGFARKTAETVSDFASIAPNLVPGQVEQTVAANIFLDGLTKADLAK